MSAQILEQLLLTKTAARLSQLVPGYRNRQAIGADLWKLREGRGNLRQSRELRRSSGDFGGVQGTQALAQGLHDRGRVRTSAATRNLLKNIAAGYGQPAAIAATPVAAAVAPLPGQNAND